MGSSRVSFFFFFNDTATTEIYTLSLHDALPISSRTASTATSASWRISTHPIHGRLRCATRDRKSTRLNSSHGYISYAVFCLKKKKKPNSRVEQSTESSTSNHQLLNRPQRFRAPT